MCSIDQAIVNIVSTAISVATHVVKAEKDRKEASYNRSILIQQAQKAEKAAVEERKEGIEDARQKKLQAILNMGKDKTRLASNNINLTSQTALNVFDNDMLNGELDALSSLNKSNQKADAYMQKASQYYAQAELNSYKSNSTSSSLIKKAKLLGEGLSKM